MRLDAHTGNWQRKAASMEPVEVEAGLILVRHCRKDIYCATVPDSCPVCGEALAVVSQRLEEAPVLIPSPFVNGHKEKFSFLLKPTEGTFLSGYQSCPKIPLFGLGPLLHSGKLVGPIQILHQAKASLDCKGGKNELSFKQGDVLDIIRLTDNPEGKWLARANGTYGYVKTTSVEVTLQKKPKPSISSQPQPAEADQDFYDDVAEQDNMGRHLPGNSVASTFPPPPSEDDIYDEMGDDEPGKRCPPQEEEKSWTWTLLKKLKGKEDKVNSAKDNDSENNEGSITLSPSPGLQHLQDSGEGDVYDDVESHDFPPPPKELGVGSYIKNLTLGRGDEKDPKKLKKIEKEKEFRKKFKYEGEINVIQSAHVLSSASTKKWGTKDLPVKPGESVAIIQQTDESKVLCRNDEGKYGYVMRNILDFGAGEIYDDIGDSCIYDND